MTSKKAKGPRAKTRRRLRRKGPKVTVSKMLQELDLDTVVQINIDSSVHSTIPKGKFQGLTGKIVGKQGRAYKVALKDGNKKKELLVVAAHLKELKHVQASGVK